MASVELATAYVSLVPTMKGAQGKIAQELGAVDADGIGKDIGGRMGGGIAGTMKSLVGPALAGLAAVGFGDLIKEAAAASDATDKFKSTMNFAGIDTSGIEKATAAAKSYADQTVYDLPTIQATMAQLASNGVTNYTELTQAAGNLNAVAGGNAETFKSVSRTLTQSAGAGKLMTEDWNMLADAIPGASGPLQKVMKEAGAFQGNFKDAMAAGEISSQEFQDALSKLGNDPIAVEAARSVTTFEGALGNLSATVNSGLMAALDALKPAITGAINGVSAGLGAMFGWFGNLFSGLHSLIMDGDITGALLSALGVEEDSPVIAGLMWVQGKIWEVFRGIQDFIAGFTIPIPDMAAQLAGGLEPVAKFGALARLKVEEGLQGVRDFVTGFTIPMPNLLAAGFDMGPMAQLGSTVRDVFDGIGTVLAPVIPQFVALWQSISPVSTIFQALLPSMSPILAILGNLVEVLGFGLLDAITGVLPAFQSLQATMVILFTDVLATVLPVIAQLVQMLGATLAELIPILVPIIVQVASLAAALIGQLAPIFMTLVSAVMPMVVESIGLILGAIGPLVSTVAGILIPIIQALLPVVVTVFGFVAGYIQSVMQVIQGIIQVVTGIISGNWAQVWDGMRNIVSGVWNAISNIIGGGLAFIGGVVMAGLGGIGRFFADTWGNVVNGVSSMIGNVVGFFSGLIGKITGAIGNAGSALFSVGVNIIQGLINGIGSMMGAIGRAVLNIVPQAIRGPFEDLLGIHSPSRVFRGYGVNIGQGLILGIGDMHGRIEDAVTGMVTVPNAPAYGANTAAGDYRTTGGFGSTFNIYETDDPIATAHAVTRRQSALAT